MGRAGNGVAWIHAGGQKSCIDGKRPRMLCSPELRTRLMMERLWRSRVGLPEGNIFLPTKSVSVSQAYFGPMSPKSRKTRDGSPNQGNLREKETILIHVNG